MKPEEKLETHEEFLARIAARHKARQAAKKPKLTLTPSPELVEAVKANPESLKVAYKTADNVVAVERVRPEEVVEVLETRDGKPSLIRRFDCASGQISLIQMDEGYRPQGVVHDYNPIDGLKRSDYE